MPHCAGYWKGGIPFAPLCSPPRARPWLHFTSTDVHLKEGELVLEVNCSKITSTFFLFWWEVGGFLDLWGFFGRVVGTWWFFELEMPQRIHWKQRSGVTSTGEASGVGEVVGSVCQEISLAIAASGTVHTGYIQFFILLGASQHPRAALLGGATASPFAASPCQSLSRSKPQFTVQIPHVITSLFPLIFETSWTHSLKMVNAWSRDGKRAASPFIWVTEPKPPSGSHCPSLIWHENAAFVGVSASRCG